MAEQTKMLFTIGKEDERYALARELFLRGGYDEADANEFQGVHCLKDTFPWISNGFCQTFINLSTEKCRVMMHFPSQELQPHKHDTDEEFIVTLGAVDLWIWHDDMPTHYRYKAGDRWHVPANTVHCYRADRVEGMVFHELSSAGYFCQRSTEFQVAPTFKMPSPFRGKTILVTGANRGIGLGFAQAFTAVGARVIAACRDPSKADALRAIEPVPTIVTLDVASEESVAALPAQLQDNSCERLDYLINNAGISVPNHPNDPILEATPALMRQVLDVNLVGTVYLTQVLLPILDAGDTKTVVNLSSQLGSITNCWAMQGRKGGVSCYRMSRAANNMAIRCFGGELADRNYIFVAMSPGHVATDMGSAGGRQAPLTVDQSVAGMLSVIGRLGLNDNGRYLQFDGTELPW